MMEAAITETGFRCALDTLHCSAVIIRGANNPVYLNKNLFKTGYFESCLIVVSVILSFLFLKTKLTSSLIKE